MQVGVWYREWEGGPRAFRLNVVNPAGNVVFSRMGRAPDDWKIWSVKLHRLGTFKTVYRTKDFEGQWIRSVFRLGYGGEMTGGRSQSAKRPASLAQYRTPSRRKPPHEVPRSGPAGPRMPFSP